MPEKVIKFFIRLRCMFIFNKTYRKKKRKEHNSGEIFSESVFFLRCRKNSIKRLFSV